MVTMIDEIYDRAYRESGSELNAALTSSVANISKLIGDSFKVLHRIEWSAPWEQKSKRARVH
jgi:hypothetical protein